jgi:hypothetical protein
MTRIEIKSTEWMIEAMREAWAEQGAGDEALTSAEISAAADAQYAWLINHTETQLPGWRFTGGTFVGPIVADAPMRILNLISESADYVLGVMDEIKAEAREAELVAQG